MIALGLPVMTSDYDYWIGSDDAATLNTALQPLGMLPTATPGEAMQKGRYVIEGEEHVDVLVARGVSTVDGTMVWFDDVWTRRIYLAITDDVSIAIPSIEDLILTKKFGARPRDADDIRWLEVLRGTKP
ncbi:MAG: hypothetical protein H0T42_10395 [Deltaproteobacteria bacterium]|nr:hypothetical protein [Deltaproteobacteria bacterium]